MGRMVAVVEAVRVWVLAVVARSLGLQCLGKSWRRRGGGGGVRVRGRKATGVALSVYYGCAGLAGWATLERSGSFLVRLALGLGELAPKAFYGAACTLSRCLR
jgi:hypothetical protein